LKQQELYSHRGHTRFYILPRLRDQRVPQACEQCLVSAPCVLAFV